MTRMLRLYEGFGLFVLLTVMLARGGFIGMARMFRLWLGILNCL
jgi:hypothetical protein